MQRPTVKLQTCAKKQIFLSLPFTGKHGMQIRTKLSKLFRSHFPQLELKVVFKPSHRLAHYFPFKDRVPLDVRSLIVYQYKCCGCNATYIGKTKRHFQRRICEHLGISSRTRRPLMIKAQSAIRDHSLDHDHRIYPHNFSILTTDQNPFELSIKENLLISKHKPELNINNPLTELQLFQN